MVGCDTGHPSSMGIMYLFPRKNNLLVFETGKDFRWHSFPVSRVCSLVLKNGLQSCHGFIDDLKGGGI